MCEPSSAPSKLRARRLKSLGVMASSPANRVQKRMSASTQSHMDRPAGAPDAVRRLVTVTIAYLAWASVAAAVAVARDLPAGFAGTHSGLSASRDFLFGMGTALSPPLWW